MLSEFDFNIVSFEVEEVEMKEYNLISRMQEAVECSKLI